MMGVLNEIVFFRKAVSCGFPFVSIYRQWCIPESLWIRFYTRIFQLPSVDCCYLFIRVFYRYICRVDFEQCTLCQDKRVAFGNAWFK